MDPIIIIESTPTSTVINPWSGICYANSGQSVSFSIMSGITGANVSFEWYLNDVLVGISSGYTLNNPTTNDNVYVKVINCVSSPCCNECVVEDIDFYCNNILGVLDYYIDLKSSFEYSIQSIVLLSDGDISNIQVLIDSIPIVWSGSVGSFNLSLSTITEITAISSNNIGSNQAIYITSSSTSATKLRGKLKIQRVRCLTTTTTTSGCSINGSIVCT